jgi:single-strand DNA-binding protein
MANNTNSITIVGNITRDPEMRYTAGGTSTATFGVAVNRSWRNQQTNEWEERTSFFNVVCWRQLAENVAASLRKGTRVVVTGRLEQRSWETEQGEKRSVVEVVADEVGPSLVFATADVHRVERSGPDGAPAPRQQQPQQPANVGGGGGSGGGNYDDYGEEPF